MTKAVDPSINFSLQQSQPLIAQSFAEEAVTAPVNSLIPTVSKPFPLNYLSRLVSWIWNKVSPLFTWILPKKKIDTQPLSPGQLADATQNTQSSPVISKGTLFKAALTLSLIGAALLYDQKMAINVGSKAIHYVHQNPAHAILAWTLFLQIKNRAVPYVNPHVLNQGRIEREFDSHRALKLGITALAAIGFGAAMYRAVNDGIEDHSLLEQAGNLTASLIHSVVNKAEHVWNYPLFQTPLGLSIPFTNTTIWHGNLPLVLPVNFTCGIANRLALAFFPSSLRHIVFFATGSTSQYVTRSMTWKLPIYLLQGAWSWATFKSEIVDYTNSSPTSPFIIPMCKARF